MIERIKQVVAQMLGDIAQTGMGTVYDYNPNLYAVRVQLQPTGIISGWMPIGSHWVGNGFGMVMGPNIGDVVRVDFVDGHHQAAIMGGRFYHDGTTPPAVPAGECWIVHSSGAYFKLTNDGKASIADQYGSVVQLTNDGNVKITGNLFVTGDISDRNGTKGTVQHIRDTYNVHHHTDSLGGITSPPNNPL